MIPKRGNRFSDEIMLLQNVSQALPIQSQWNPL